MLKNFLRRLSIIASILGFALFLFFFPATVWAAEEFETAYHSTYTVNKEALVFVNQQINIKNRLSNIYVSEYAITIGSNRIGNITLSDASGSLTPLIEVGPNYTRILVKFKSKVVGKDQETRLNLSYQTLDFAVVNGQILELGIPSVTRREELKDYTVSLIVPNYFGPPSLLQPKPISTTKSGENTLYFFTKDRLLKTEGIAAAFGEAQIFNFRLLYELENPQLVALKTEISLPSDTDYQKVFYTTIQPPPLEIKVDRDDNWLAIYMLKAKEKLSIVASGSAEIYIRPQEPFKTSLLSEEEIKLYLQPQKYWETDSEEIKALGQNLKTAKAIYDYVVENLIYDYGRLESSLYQRLGAAAALKNKNSALCPEFTDLFISLCRAAGIPAREVDGYAYTTNPKLRPLSLSQDVLHAWAEYYDRKKNLWLPVDPTWGNTTGGIDFFSKLDLNHFAFVRHGIKSDYPPPAGAFNLNASAKTVFIEFGSKRKPATKVNFVWDLPVRTIAGLTMKGRLTVTNVGQIAYHQPKIILKIDNQEQELKLKVLPPYATHSWQLLLKTTWHQAKIHTLNVTFDGEESIWQGESLPFYSYIWQKILTLWGNLQFFRIFPKLG